MNDERRKKLREAVDCLCRALSLVDEVANDEREAFENLPEGMRQGEKGSWMEGAVDLLNDAYSKIEKAVGNVETASE